MPQMSLNFYENLFLVGSPCPMTSLIATRFGNGCNMYEMLLDFYGNLSHPGSPYPMTSLVVTRLGRSSMTFQMQTSHVQNHGIT